MRVLLFLLVFITASTALEFDDIGHKSSAMGGAGVALRNNPYAIFYNPAMISANDKPRMGYSFNGLFSERALVDVFNYDLNNISDIPSFNELLKDNILRTKVQGVWALKAPSNLIIGDLSLGLLLNIHTASTFTGELPNNISAINDEIDFNIRRLDTVELPVAYAFSLDTLIGKMSWGASFKFMSFSSMNQSRKLNVDDSKSSIQEDIKDVLKANNAISDYNFGLDLGFVYIPSFAPDFTFGLSGKNLNRPEFDFKRQGKITAFPQARLGIAYELGQYLTVAADADLTQNPILVPRGSPIQYSQKIGIGIDVSTTFFDARAGFATDIRQKNGLIASFGLGIGFVDLGVSVSTKKAKVDDITYPRYISLHLGGSYDF